MAGIYIYSQPIQTGKTTRLQNWVNAHKQMGGILTPDINGSRKLFRINTNETHDFQQANDTNAISIGRFHFNASKFELARNTLYQDLNQQLKWIVVDEIGRLEMDRKEGLEPAIGNIISQYQHPNSFPKLLLVVRDYLLRDAISHYHLHNAMVLDNDFFEYTSMSHSDKPVGLVLCGGKSTRMGTDKAMIDYHGMPQYEYAAKLLSKYCDEVVISCNAEQATMMCKTYKLVVDDPKIASMGPMTGVLSVKQLYPNRALLVLGCDYPYINYESLDLIQKNRSEHADVVCFVHPESGYAEPLIACYEAEAINLLKCYTEKGFESLRHFVSMLVSRQIVPLSAKHITSIDSLRS
jgi:molybdopterin-guanine dinucleotide biosynthesis protein A/nucleoside-triphosphatase THEP1